MGPFMKGCPKVHHPFMTVWLEELSGKPALIEWPYGP